MEFEKIYFLGIGGIGMSALARYFLHEGRQVAGYDRTPSELTEALEQEGAQVTYSDDPQTVPVQFTSPQDTLVVYTPAIPNDSILLNFFRQRAFTLKKRSRMLGVMAQGRYLMAVAGTHGKTTTSTMAAWFNSQAGDNGCAFLGGISKNFESNLVLGPGNRMVAEADEFDRSFLQLYPDVAVITAVDADHLDIYGTHQAVKEAFETFAGQIRPGGTLILKTGVNLKVPCDRIKVYRYSYDQPCDFYAEKIRVGTDGCYAFDLHFPDSVLPDCRLGIPGWINVENCVAASAMLWVAGCDRQALRESIGSFRGVRRRFDFHINTPQRIYMDDYAHHPEELKATLTSVREMFPGRKITVVFQPHLYTRTRDFYCDFASVLSLSDEVLLLPIYPAREKPIEGVNSEMLLPQISVPAQVVQKEDLLDTLRTKDPQLLITFGAGDIDRFCTPITALWKS